MAKKVRITIIDTGAFCCGGIVSDPEAKRFIQKRIESGSVESFMFGDEEFEDFSIDTHATTFNVYGPCVDSETIVTLESCSDDTIDDYEEYFEGMLSDTDTNHYTTSNPDLFDMDKSEFSADDLIIMNEKIEKRVHYSVEINLGENEQFKLGNVYIGSMNMDESTCSGEIVEQILYISDDLAMQYVREWCGEGEDDYDALGDLLDDIRYESPELFQKIVNNHSLEVGDIFGKGEWENDYIKVTTLDGDVLFEDGQY